MSDDEGTTAYIAGVISSSQFTSPNRSHSMERLAAAIEEEKEEPKEEQKAEKTVEQSVGIEHSKCAASIALFMSFFAGMCATTTAMLSAELTRYVGHAIRSSCITMLVTVLLFAGIVVAQRGWRLINWELLKAAPWWHIVAPGGFGAIIMFGMISLAPVISYGTVLVAFVVGQLATSITLEHNAWLGARKNQISIVKVLLFVVVIAGVVCVKGFNSDLSKLLYLAASVAIGVPAVLQVVVNNMQTVRLGSGVNATWVSYATGAIILLVASGISYAFVDGSEKPLSDAPWWSFLGGFSSGTHILISCIAPRYIGPGLFFVGKVLGSLVAAVIYDLAVKFDGTTAEVTWMRVVGLFVVFCGVCGLHILRTYFTPQQESSEATEAPVRVKPQNEDENGGEGCNEDNCNVTEFNRGSETVVGEVDKVVVVAQIRDDAE